MRPFMPFALLLFTLASCIACTTTNHTVYLTETDMGTPISASGYFVGKGGAVFGKERYRIVDHFTVDDRFENRIGRKGHTAMNLKKLLEPVIRKNKADAIVNLRISAKQFDHGNTMGIGILRNVGITSGFVAGLFFVAGAAFDADTSEGVLKMSDIGVGFAIPAVIGLGGSYLLELFSKTSWTIRIEGDAVRM